jgi:UDP-glucose:(heptosyl)LPS alpha-1,3-glucosyltransferase
VTSKSLRLAVVSPFLDKRHGTERCVAEQVERLAGNYGHEVHVFSERLEDIKIGRVSTAGECSGGGIVWHPVPGIRGPQLFKYLWWFAVNHWVRFVTGLKEGKYDIVYSPGINCLDADLISVHIVFREFYEKAASELSLRKNSFRSWIRILHRQCYYWLIIRLERVVYRNENRVFAAISRKTAIDLRRWYSNRSDIVVSYYGIDGRFNPATRRLIRQKARLELGLSDDAFAVLLIGNDWRKKGLFTLLEAAALLEEPRPWLLVVGEDDPELFEAAIKRLGLRNRVLFLPVRRDVEMYYAAGDLYVGASLEDAFALPVAEAMACGLPVIVSRFAGASEIVTDGVDALVLEDPKDATNLMVLIKRLLQDRELCRFLGERAAVTASSYSWDRNTADLQGLVCRTVDRKRRGGIRLAGEKQ